MDSNPDHKSFRFPRTARLTRAAEFQKVRAEGQSCHGKFIILNVLKTSQPDTRVGVITSRRLGNAVKRNKVRRRLREMVRLTFPKLQKGLWLVLVARRAAVEVRFKTIETEWLNLAQRASILTN